MRQNLQSTALHKRVVDVQVHAPNLIPSDSASAEAVVEQLKEHVVGHSFASTRRHGKWMFVALNDGSDDVLMLHFGMTGGLKCFKEMDDEPKYDRVLFRFTNGYQLTCLSKRKLGEVEVIDNVEQFIDRKGTGTGRPQSGFRSRCLQRGGRGPARDGEVDLDGSAHDGREGIMIPRYEATIAHISDALEEKEREDIIHAKKVKQLYQEAEGAQDE